jgi:transposase
MRLVYERCAALDVGKHKAIACPRWTNQGGITEEARAFATIPSALLAMTDWLRRWEVTAVALVGRDPHWKPVHSLLHGEFEVKLVPPEQVDAAANGRSGLETLRWLAERLAYDELATDVVLTNPPLILRELIRRRANLVQERDRALAALQGLLQATGVPVLSVAAAGGDGSGRRLLAAILDAGAGAELMVKFGKGRLCDQVEAIEHALLGVVPERQRFLLAQHLAHIDTLDEQVAQINEKVGRWLGIEPAPQTLADIQARRQPQQRRRLSWSNTSLY